MDFPLVGSGPPMSEGLVLRILRVKTQHERAENLALLPSCFVQHEAGVEAPEQIDNQRAALGPRED